MNDQRITEYLAPTEDFPSPETPIFFADGVTNISPGPQMAKINFAKIDQSLKDPANIRVTTALQLVMPLDSFIQTAQFMTNIVDGLIKNQFIQEDKVKAIRDSAGGRVDTSD